MLYIYDFYIADSAGEVKYFRFRELFGTEPVTVRILFILFPDYRRRQTFFNGGPYGETKIGICIAIIISISYIYFINLVKEMFFDRGK